MGAAIKARREELKLSQKEATALIGGISAGTLSEVELGKNHPSLDLYLKICAALKMPKPPFAP